MHLSPRDQEKLLVVVAADLARRRQKRGLKLNYPEAVSIITYEIFEGARDGKSVAELMSFGATLLNANDVMEGVGEMLHEVQVEATFPDGTKLVTVHHPIRPVPVITVDENQGSTLVPGQIKAVEGPDLEANHGLETLTLTVANSGDRPIQVGSHFHFYEVNNALIFEREKSRGFRLNIPAGTAVRFEPGDTRVVQLVAMAGERVVHGLNNRVNGRL